MKRNEDKVQAEVTNEEFRLRVAPTPANGNGGAPSLPAHRATGARPEIAVLGWDVRSYRLSLRTSKF
jgi:hypothetical protein